MSSEALSNMKSVTKAIIESNGESLTDIFKDVGRKFDSCSSSLDKLLEQIAKLSEKKDSFIIDLNHFHTYLESLNLLQLHSLLHSLVFILIFSFLFNIISALIGNEIVNYFHLQDKFPRLSKILQLRAKFQKYYMLLNLLGIFILISLLLAFNLYFLF